MKSKLKIEQIFEVIDKLIELYPDNVESFPDKYGSKKDILEAEHVLGVNFPEDFKKFILKYGCVLFFWGYEIFGSGALDITLSERDISEGNLESFPKSLIAVYEYGDGSTSCIDTSKNNSMVFWDGYVSDGTEEGWIFDSEPCFESFTEFLFYYVVDSYEYKCERDRSIKEERARYEPDDEPIDEPDEESVVFDKEVECLKKEIEYLKTLSSHYNKDKPYLTLV